MKNVNYQLASYKKSKGLSLVELMIAMMLGILAVGVIIFMFIQTSDSSRKNSRFIDMQENARFALNILSYDIRHAGFYGGMLYGQFIAKDSTLPTAIDCGSGVEWLYDFESDMEIYINNSSSPSKHSCITDLYTGFDSSVTETLAIRSVIPYPVATSATHDDKRLYIRSDKISACLWWHDTSTIPTGADCPDNSDTLDWELVSNIYYIVNNNGIPTLYRKKINTGSAAGLVSEPLVDNIERFHIDFGVDSDGDNIVDQYMPPASLTNIGDVISARIYVLVRSDQASQNYTSGKTYTLGNLQDASGNALTISDPDDGRYRRVYSTTVLLRNIANLRVL